MGVRGRTDTGSKSIFTDRAELYAKPNQGYLKTWGVGWGLENPGGVNTDIKRGYSVSTGGDTQKSSDDMMPRDDYFCYLTKVQGEFDGGAEWAKVQARNGTWYLDVHAGCKNRSGLKPFGRHCSEYKTVKAKASCYKRNQNP
jgi:hypothetical protein